MAIVAHVSSGVGGVFFLFSHPFLSLGIWGCDGQQSLLQKSLKERRTALRNTFKEIDGRFRFATFMDHKV